MERLEERHMLAADLYGLSGQFDDGGSLATGDTFFETQQPVTASALVSGGLIGHAPPPDPERLASLGTLLGGTLAAGAATPAEVAAAFSLHSLPGALHTIYLDFDGHLTRDTQWNDDFSNPNIFTAAFSLDENFAGFSSDELFVIEEVWARVSEDFRPFQVNVTTQDPGIEALRNTGEGDLQWGQRVVIGGSTNDWYTPIDGEAVGGVAYGSFTWDTDAPTFAFAADFAGDAKSIAEVVSHEVGHTLGLAHDGQFRDWLNVEDPDNPEWTREWIEYYAGHGAGPTGWASIMGVGYSRELTQWSWSEYPNATNNEAGTSPLQDDLAIITGQNGFDYRVDDHGNSIDTASPLILDADGKLYSAEGIIERRTDVDYFSFTVKGLGELVTFDIAPFQRGPNLDILAKVYDASGVEVASSNPLDELYASFTDLVLTPGTYYLSIEGTGRPITFIDPVVHPGPVPDLTSFADHPPDMSDWGYSDYASLGYYSIAGTRKPLLVGVDFDVAEGTSPENWNLFSGGGPQATLSNLLSEAGVAMPYDLSISTTGPTINSVLSTSPINSADLPNHARPLNALDGYISATDETWTFVWSDLEPSSVYQVYVFGHADGESRNAVTVAGGVWNGIDQTIDFTQMVAPNGLVVNEHQAPGGADLATLTYFVISTESGEITITVNNEDGFAAALAGLAIAPTEVGSIEGQKWNDRNGDRTKGGGEEGLPGWTVYLDLNNNGVLDFNSTPDQEVTQVAPNVPQTILDLNIVKNELFFEEVGEILDVDVTLDISHTFVADLDMFLVSPAGTRVRLMNDHGGFGDNLAGTIFDDAAARSITSVTPSDAPFTGRFRPLQPLSAFNGEDSNGIWTLEIKDDAPADNGVLNSWSLTITVAGVEIFLEPVTVTDADGNYSFTDLQAGSYHVREHIQEQQVLDGWQQTWAPPPVTVSSEARIKGIDIGNWIPVLQRGSIQGQKWNDLDGDGEKDAEEPGLPDWTIYIDSNGNGVRDLATTPMIIANTDPPKAIQDFSQVMSQVTFDDLGTVLKVEVTLDVTHSFVGDLDAFLISPSGRTVELFTGVGGQFNDLQNLTLDDDAARSIGTIGGDDLPYTGTWRPEGLLSDFLGDDANGAWTLLIRDTAFADQGTLNSWSLAITAGEPFTETAEDGSYVFDNLPPGQYRIGEAPRPGWVQVPPATTSIPGAVWADSQWTVTVVGLDDPNDPNGPDARRNVKNVDFGNQALVLLPGDYNGDNMVDLADYIAWRKTMGTNVDPYSGADGDGNGIVDDGDYGLWKANFGKSVAPATASVTLAAVPATGELSSGAVALAVESLAPSVQTTAFSSSLSGVPASSPAPVQGAPVFNLDADFGKAVSTSRAAYRPTGGLRLAVSVASNDAALLQWVSALPDDDRGLQSADNDWSSDDQRQPNDDDFESVDLAFDDLAALATR